MDEIKNSKEFIEEQKLNEVVSNNHDDYETVNEMARGDNPHGDRRNLKNNEIWVYEKDRDDMTPHFHYFNRKDKNKWEVEIHFDSLKISKSSPREGVDNNELCTWKKLTDERDALEIWLNSPNDTARFTTNYEMLVALWNSLNTDNMFKIPDDMYENQKLKKVKVW